MRSQYAQAYLFTVAMVRDGTRRQPASQPIKHLPTQRLVWPSLDRVGVDEAASGLVVLLSLRPQ